MNKKQPAKTPAIEADSPATDAVADIPEAGVHRDRGSLIAAMRQRPSKVWLLALACLFIAVALFWSGYRTRATKISIRFEQGHGIRPGDRLQHRGIDVGEVTAVTLNHELSQVDVQIELESAATELARQGSRFWIERPRISLARVSGLETVVGAKYVGVQPGPPSGPRETTFIGDESPPTLRDTATQNIQIRFGNGHGLTNGDVIKYRGIIVGEVESIELDEPLDGIVVHARLATNGRRLAQAGTQFWIERPRVQLTAVSGLETLTGGQHIAADAGPVDAPAQQMFDGLEVPPTLLEQQPDGLEVVLNSRDRRGIERGAPLTYRGLLVGHVASVGLSADASQIETRLYVDPAYRQLIRNNSVFWSVGGFDASFGFGGLKINSETLATIAAGGVALATPDPPGAISIMGARFELREEPSDWREWTPRIPVGNALLPEGTMLPQPVRVALIWRQRFLGIAQSTQTSGWGLVLEDQRLIGPADLLSPPAAAVGGSAELQFEGTTIATETNQVDIAEGLAWRRLAESSAKGWPLDQIRPLTMPEDCLIVMAGIDDTRSLPATRLGLGDDGMAIDPSFTLPEDAHGASVVAVRDGKLVGIIAIVAGRATLLNVEPLAERK